MCNTGYAPASLYNMYAHMPEYVVESQKNTASKTKNVSNIEAVMYNWTGKNEMELDAEGEPSKEFQNKTKYDQRSNDFLFREWWREMENLRRN